MVEEKRVHSWKSWTCQESEEEEKKGDEEVSEEQWSAYPSPGEKQDEKESRREKKDLLFCRKSCGFERFL